MTWLTTLLKFQRTILMILVFIGVAGTYAYLNVPKESNPDVKIPVILVNVLLSGISPEDSETLLLRPLEQELKSLDGLKTIKSQAFEGGVHISLEFQAGFDNKKALTEVREKVSRVKGEFPPRTEEPMISEISLALMPVLAVNLSGAIPSAKLYAIAEELKKDIESIPQVLAVQVDGKPQEIVDVIIQPEILQNYGLTAASVIRAFAGQKSLIAPGRVSTDTGVHSLKTKGGFTTLQDIYDLPLSVDALGGAKVGQITTVGTTYNEVSKVRTNGVTSVTLNISKRTGENILLTVEAIKNLVAKEQSAWPATLKVTFSADTSDTIWDMIHDLQNEITTAVILVLLVMILMLGLRPALLVAIAIPGSFLMGVLFLFLQGHTLNIVVLFSLILSVGMLVDGAIIVVEYADRRINEGMPSNEAFVEAAQRMFWPVVTSITTIIVAFMPLLFWPGVMGQFMRYMPITLIATLTASITMALIFVPTLAHTCLPLKPHLPAASATSKGLFFTITTIYGRWLDAALNHPARVLLGALSLLIVVIGVFGVAGKGSEFFPNVEPENGFIVVKAKGNFSLAENDRRVRQVEAIVRQNPHLKLVTAKALKTGMGSTPDEIGSIYMEYKNWQKRPKVPVIMKSIMAQLAPLPGIVLEEQLEQSGPNGGKPIEVQISGSNPQALTAAVREFRAFLDQRKGLRQIEDNRSSAGLEWRFHIDKFKAAQLGVNLADIDNALKILTSGIYIADYWPDNGVEALDIVVRYPKKDRHLGQLSSIYLPTPHGQVPLTAVVTQTYGPQVSVIHHVNGDMTYTLTADVDAGTLAQPHISAIKTYIQDHPIKGVTIALKGQEESQQETGDFLIKAFGAAIFLIALILVTQFNSFYSMVIVLSAVVMSTIGVLLGLLVRGLPFGIVMGGVGVIALAGIIVSNNIIFIDTYDHLRAEGKSLREAIHEAGMLRLRPVILTKLTMVLGLLPIASRLTIDYAHLTLTYGAPSTEWWVMLSTTIIAGLLFASPLTLFVTPCALMYKDRLKGAFRR